MTEFTEGEWEAFIGCTDVIAIVSNNIAVVSWQGFDDLDMPKLEKKANANLMAAAPDMYKLLQEIKHVLLKVGNGPSWETNQIEKLLTKARGE